MNRKQAADVVRALGSYVASLEGFATQKVAEASRSQVEAELERLENEIRMVADASADHRKLAEHLLPMPQDTRAEFLGLLGKAATYELGAPAGPPTAAPESRTPEDAFLAYFTSIAR